MTPNPNNVLQLTDVIQEPSTSSSNYETFPKPIKDKSMPLCGSYRLFVVICGCLAMCMSFSSQTSMSSAMVCMIKDANNEEGSGIANSTVSGLDVEDLGQNTTDSQPWKFSWDSKTKGWVISSYFAGFYIMQIPSGILVSKFGPKSSMVTGLFLAAIFHILSIPAARWNITVLYLIRFLAGVATSCLLPGTYALVANWAPISETSLLYGIAGAGLEVGNSLSFFISMFGCETNFQGGWPIVFYTIGCLHFLLGLIMNIGVTNFPSTNRFIVREEARYIATNSAYGDKKRNNRIPVGQILRSLPVWGFLISELGTEWMYYTISTQGPLFLRDIIELPPWKTNIVSSVPYLAIIPLVFVIGYTSDKLIEKEILSTTSVRKANDIYSKIFTGGALFALGFLAHREWLGPFLMYFVVAVGISGTYAGYMANPGDLSPSHAGFLAALGQAATTWTSFVIPVLTGNLTTGKNRYGWQIIFCIAAGVEVFCLIFFIVFGSGKLQAWAVEEVNEETPATWRGDEKTD